MEKAPKLSEKCRKHMNDFIRQAQNYRSRAENVFEDLAKPSTAAEAEHYIRWVISSQIEAAAHMKLAEYLSDLGKAIEAGTHTRKLCETHLVINLYTEAKRLRVMIGKASEQQQIAYVQALADAVDQLWRPQ